MVQSMGRTLHHHFVAVVYNFEFFNAKIYLVELFLSEENGTCKFPYCLESERPTPTQAVHSNSTNHQLIEYRHNITHKLYIPYPQSNTLDYYDN